MEIIRKNKVAIIFYVVMVSLALLLSARTDKLESTKDYNQYNDSIVMNTI